MKLPDANLPVMYFTFIFLKYNPITFSEES